MAVSYTHLKNAKIVTDLVNPSSHLISCLIGGLFQQIGINLHCSAKAATLVHIKSHQTLLAFTYSHSLFMVWKKKIFLQSPVEKSADPCYLAHLKKCRLPYSQRRFSCCCDQAVLGILINKYFQPVPFFSSLGNLFCRKKHAVLCISLFILCRCV